MERLYEIHSSGTYDLIVVDTPPTRNAIDFLEAPDRMGDFFSSKLLRWLTAPSKSPGHELASKPFYTVADRILGSQFLEDIAEFFRLFQTMAPGFVERADAVSRILADKRTTFVVVSTLEAAPLHEAEFFIEASLDERKLTSGRWCSTRCCRPTCAAPPPPVWPSACAPMPTSWPPVSPDVGDPADVARVLRHHRRELPQLPGGRQARGRAARQPGPQPRRGGRRALLRRRHRTTSPACSQLGDQIWR
jgi:hypothetical protein